MKKNQTSIQANARLAAAAAGNAGFSLVELLVVAVVFGVVFIAITRVLMTTVTSDARLTEQSEAQNRGGIITDLLQTDFQNPLHLLSSSPISSTGTFPASFAASSDYQLSAGYAKRLMHSTTDPLLSSVVLESLEGKAGFTLSTNTGASFGWHTRGTDFSRNFQTISLSPFDGSTRRFTVYSQNGAEVSGSVTGEPSSFETRVEQLSIGCRVAFYAVFPSVTTLLARSLGACSTFPLETVADVYQDGGVISNAALTGLFVPRDEKSQSAPLPFVGTAQIATPIFLNPENNDLVLFRADDAADKTFSLNPASFQAQNQTTVTAKPPLRGSYAAGDYLFIVDYVNLRSVVCRIGNIVQAPGGTIQITVTPNYTPSDAAWGLFYSRPIDFTGATFPPGAEIVHLAPPVSYRFVASYNIIVRREGSGLFQTVAPGIQAFNASVAGGSLNVEILANTEGVETDNTTPAQQTLLSIPIQ